jgi:hypothetical protein
MEAANDGRAGDFVIEADSCEMKGEHREIRPASQAMSSPVVAEIGVAVGLMLLESSAPAIAVDRT